MIIQISKADTNNDDIITVLRQGSHVVGRGDTLHCQDKRVSRNHAQIDVSETEVSIKSKANNKSVSILTTRDPSVPLTDGDKFSFLPEAFWFKIKCIYNDSKSESNDLQKKPTEKRLRVEEEEVQTQIQINDEEPASSSEAPQKRPKIDELPTQIDSSPQKSEKDNPSPTPDQCDVLLNQVTTATEVQNEAENGVIVTPSETVSPVAPTSVPIVPKVEDSTHTDAKKTDEGSTNSPGTSSDKKDAKQRRERCWYGSNCYRKNPTHRVDFSHPEDGDYASDPDDDRPSCSYGGACYRKNPQHRRDYKHPSGPPPSQSKSASGSVTINNYYHVCQCCRKCFRPKEENNDDSDYESD